MRHVIVPVLVVALLSPTLSLARDKIRPMLSDAPTEQEYAESREAILYEVNPMGASYKAGIRSGDVLTAINGNAVRTINDALPLIHSASGSVALDIKRSNEFRKIIVHLPPPRLVGDPPRFGFAFIPDKTQLSMSTDNTNEMTMADVVLSGVGIRACVNELGNYYVVGVALKNLEKKNISAPYSVSLRNSNGTIARFMTPNELLYATYGGQGGYVPPPPPPVSFVLPSTYVISSSSTTIGGITRTQGTITPMGGSLQQGLQTLQQGMYSFGVGLGRLKAAKTAAEKQQFETWLNNNYLRNTTIPPDTHYMGIVYFAKGLQDADGVVLTVGIDERNSVDMSFVRGAKESKKKKRK